MTNEPTRGQIIGETIAANAGMHAPTTSQGPGDPAQGPAGGGRAVAAARREAAYAHAMGVAANSAAQQVVAVACVGRPSPRRRSRWSWPQICPTPRTRPLVQS